MNFPFNLLSKLLRANFIMWRNLLRWLTGDWWRPVFNGTSWGIYHPIRKHDWGYGLTKKQAVHKCRMLNHNDEI